MDAGGKWMRLRNEFRAPAVSIAWSRLKAARKPHLPWIMQFKLGVKSDLLWMEQEWWSIGAMEHGHCFVS